MLVRLPIEPCLEQRGFDGAGIEGTSSFEFYEHNVGNHAVGVIGQDWSSEVVALFLEDWEPGRVALNCHMTVNLSCQELRDACWDCSESLGSSCSLCSQCREGFLAGE